MALAYRPVSTRDLLAIERLVREVLPEYRVGQTEVKALLGHQPGRPHRLLVVREDDEPIGLVGVYVDADELAEGRSRLVGPLLQAARRERLYTPTIVRQALDAAREAGARTVLAQRAEGEGVRYLTRLLPTLASREFYTWRGRDLLAEAGFRVSGETRSLALPAEVPVRPSRVPTPFRLRPLEPARDAEALAHVLNAALGVAMRPEHLRAWPAGAGLVAEAEGAVVGAATWDAERGALNDLAVLAERQGRGLGRALLTHAVVRLRETGHTTVTLQAPRENARALALFSSVGFRHDATYSTLTCTL